MEYTISKIYLKFFLFVLYNSNKFCIITTNTGKYDHLILQSLFWTIYFVSQEEINVPINFEPLPKSEGDEFCFATKYITQVIKAKHPWTERVNRIQVR